MNKFVRQFSNELSNENVLELRPTYDDQDQQKSRYWNYFSCFYLEHEIYKSNFIKIKIIEKNKINHKIILLPKFFNLYKNLLVRNEKDFCKNIIFLQKKDHNSSLFCSLLKLIISIDNFEILKKLEEIICNKKRRKVITYFLLNSKFLCSYTFLDLYLIHFEKTKRKIKIYSFYLNFHENIFFTEQFSKKLFLFDRSMVLVFDNRVKCHIRGEDCMCSNFTLDCARKNCVNVSCNSLIEFLILLFGVQLTRIETTRRMLEDSS